MAVRETMTQTLLLGRSTRAAALPPLPSVARVSNPQRLPPPHSLQTSTRQVGMATWNQGGAAQTPPRLLWKGGIDIGGLRGKKCAKTAEIAVLDIHLCWRGMRKLSQFVIL